MNIKNFSELALNPERKQALLILEAGLDAINTHHAVQNAVAFNVGKELLTVQGKNYSLAGKDRVVVVGFGKAAFDAVHTLYDVLGSRIACGFVVDLRGGKREGLTCTVGTHPFPTMVNVEATKHIMEVVHNLTENDLLLCVVSGGGSSLLCYPYELSCEVETEIVKTLMQHGATIAELNTVRKHISRVKGGQLAQAAYPAEVINLIFSDVPGDKPEEVASGPTLFDTTTVRDAARILTKYNILEECKIRDIKLCETPKEAKYFKAVSTHVLVSGRQALAAMKEKAADLGFRSRIYREGYSGIARDLAVEFVEATLPGECLIASGESTVRVKPGGKGGRNLEMALAALPMLGPGHAFAAIDTDGYDNTPFAGALVDAHTRKVAEELHMSPALELEANSSYIFFEAVGDYINTGLTGANSADLVVSLRRY